MKISLPICTPSILSFPRWSYLLGITECYKETEDWFFSNFAQIACNNDYYERGIELFIDYWRGGQEELLCNNPFLYYRIVGYDIFDCIPLSVLEEMLVSQIKKGFYPIIFLDEAKLPFSPYYSKNGDSKFPHHCLIYGYDENSNEFLTAGFGLEDGDIYQKFSFYKVDSSLIQAAISSMSEMIKSGQIHDQNSLFVKARIYDFADYPYGYPFNLDLLKSDLLDYINGLNSRESNNFYTKRVSFGVAVYDVLIEYFLLLDKDIKSIPERQRADIRHIHVLEEHKRILVKKMMYIAEKYSVNFDDEIAQCKNVSSALMKIKIILLNTNKPANFARIAANLAKIKVFDKEVATSFLNKISLID
ncbi:hypothetical protein [Chitinibacter sp. ZOR0017]|uniref:hypothetical protein n=1 Tax=Chitinibacter sp. ZOR0017 TaxID=1339254 RepID=UPI000645FB43|nr:hypothetical protein [Chitinibacter sp. ZOR0017]